jgi:HEAT repeat protein
MVEAISMLATMVKTAKDHDIQSRALSSISSNQDRRSLPALIDLLSDSDPRLPSEALIAIAKITGAPACRQDAGEAESIVACKSWWEREGHLLEWTSSAEQ